MLSAEKIQLLSTCIDRRQVSIVYLTDHDMCGVLGADYIGENTPKMKISGLNIRLRIFVHEYLQSAKQKSNARDNGGSRKGKQIGKKGGDLKDTKISDKEAKKANQNHSKPQFNERFYPKKVNCKLTR